MRTKTQKARVERPDPPSSEGAAPRVVYIQAPVLLGRAVERAREGQCVVEVGGQRQTVGVDSCVDPALIDRAVADRSRVVLDSTDGAPVVVGVLMTRPTLEVDASGRVAAKLTSLELDVAQELVLKSRGAFLRIKNDEVELFADRIIHRARGLVKLLGAIIKLN